METYRRLRAAIELAASAEQLADVLAELAGVYGFARYGCVIYLPNSVQSCRTIIISNHPDGVLGGRLSAVHGIGGGEWPGWSLHGYHGTGGERCGLAMMGRTGIPSDMQQLQLADLARRLFASLLWIHRQPRLRDVERDVLYWTAAGKRTDEISTITGIPERTINEHIKTARRKLDAKTRQQAVINALLQGEISPRWKM